MTDTTRHHPHKNSLLRLNSSYRRSMSLSLDTASTFIFAILLLTLSQLLFELRASADSLVTKQINHNQINHNQFKRNQIAVNLEPAGKLLATNVSFQSKTPGKNNSKESNHSIAHYNANSLAQVSPNKSSANRRSSETARIIDSLYQPKRHHFGASHAQYGYPKTRLMGGTQVRQPVSHDEIDSNRTVWPKNRRLAGGRAEENPYGLSFDELQKSIEQGKIWLSNYPVDHTPLVLPYDLVSDILDREARTRPFVQFFIKLTGFRPWSSKNDFYSWLGLTREDSEASNEPQNDIPVHDQFYGVSLHERNGIKAMTFGCASCHIGRLFGKKVTGLTVRFPRSNELFLLSGNFMTHVNAKFLAPLLSANPGETDVLIKDDKVSQHIGAKLPISLGLDTSLAQVGLSLNKRLPDSWASFSNERARRPPKHYLMDHRADSKPAVWWNVKYKTRWLSDASLEGGNPVHTNFLWNEIGRGADLRQLESWLRENQTLSRDMINAILNTTPPRYVDFFGPDSIDIEKAKKGQILFNQACSNCHGTYLKVWNETDGHQVLVQKMRHQSIPETSNMGGIEALAPISTNDLGKKVQFDPTATVYLRYHEETPVFDVGTDAGRYLGMASFADSLNRLAISKYMATEVIPKRGYVAPPLDGIWARYPYFHNNAVPSLCQVLTAGKDRVKVYLAVAPEDKDRDFDHECVGYPRNLTDHPAIKVRFDTTLEGQNNSGHDEGIFLQSGKEIFNWDEKKAIIEFLKTL